MIDLLISIVIATSAQAAPVDKEAYDVALRQSVRASGDCLQRQVELRVPSGRETLDLTERRAIAVAAADACYEHAKALAKLTSDVRRDGNALKRVTTAMLVTSMEIANGLISVKLSKNVTGDKQ